VTLPFVPKISVMALAFGHIAIGLFGLLGIIVFGCRLGHAYESIKRQSVMDALTEIPNRRSFMERIEIECNRSQREGVALSVIMGDIDYFKQYNDTYGHKAGDECLNRVAQAIKKSLRRPGDFCARYGGEEFVVVLANTSKEGGLVVAETIRKNILDMAIAHKKSSWNIVSLSLGVAESNKDMPLTSDDIVVQADSALYTAKEKGRNRVEAFGGSGNHEC
jgi:diguanylate cyclase (GGDEF)-like protein